MTGMMLSPRRAVPLMAILLALTGLAGCSSDEPDLCTSVDALESSVDNLKNVQLGENGLAEVETYLTQIRDDITDVTTAAKQEFEPEVDAVTDAVDDIDEVLRIAKDKPSAATLRPLAEGVTALASGLTALQQAVSDSC
jgi:hypothetical protein